MRIKVIEYRMIGGSENKSEGPKVRMSECGIYIIYYIVRSSEPEYQSIPPTLKLRRTSKGSEIDISII